MRTLTIKRTKSFVACLAKMKIYIEDPSSNDIVINNVSCRKLGELKNGEEMSFKIGTKAAKVFVIAGKLSKSFCNEYYAIPAGNKDVYLTGKNRFNLAGGNAFRFDNNDNKDALANRKAGTRKGLIILCAAFAVGIVAGFAVGSGLFSAAEVSEPKTFSSDGVTITLTESFNQTSAEGYTVCFESKDVAVFILREDFSLIEGLGNYTLEQYGNLMLTNNGLGNSALKTADGLTYFERDYTNPDSGDVYRFTAYVYKTEDAFWLVQFAVPKGSYRKYSSHITDWAKSVEFSDAVQ